MKKFTVLFILLVSLIGCSKKGNSYCPLDEGKTWTYQVSISGFLIGNKTINATITNLSNREINGKETVPQKLDINNQTYFTFISEDSKGSYELGSQGPGMVEPEVRSKPNYFIKYPFKVGTEWEYETNTSLLNEKINVNLKSRLESTNETVTVPAGTFNDCLKIKSTGVAKKKIGWNKRESKADIVHYYWYAPGIGNIKTVIEEKGDFYLAGGSMVIQLESFKQ